MVLTYIKRTIVLGFLIIIAPLITITYAIDKMGDGKSQALNTWMREFIFTVIIQPFHCIIYLVFYSSIINSFDTSSLPDVLEPIQLGKLVFMAASAFFMLKAEGIVKKIFGIQPSGIGDAIGTGAMAITMGTSLFKGKGGKKVNESKGKMPNMRKNADTKKKEEKTGNQSGSNPIGAGAGSDITGGTGGSSGTGSQSGSTGNSGSNYTQQTGSNGSANNTNKKHKSAIMRGISGAGRFLKNDFNRNGGLGGHFTRNISRGAAIAGLIAGATVGDAKTAASVATATKGIADNVENSIKYKVAEERLENNQQEFAGAYEDFAVAYRQEYGEDVTDKQIAQAAKEIYDGGGVDNLDSDYARDFYEKMDQLSTSAEIIGYKDGFDYVKDTMRMVQGEAISSRSDYEHKYYDVKPKPKTKPKTKK